MARSYRVGRNKFAARGRRCISCRTEIDVSCVAVGYFFDRGRTLAGSVLSADSKHESVAYEIVDYDLIRAFTHATDGSAERTRMLPNLFFRQSDGTSGAELAATYLWPSSRLNQF
jgi:hypothetical protein